MSLAALCQATASKFQLLKCCTYTRICSAAYAKKPAVGKAPLGKKKQLELVEDPEKLSRFLCGGNVYKEGQDPELKPDSEYPDWLWELRTDRTPLDLSELDQETWYYWRRLRKHNNKQNMKLLSTSRLRRY